MNNPLVSVIIPAYNAEKFITEALNSVFAQAYRPIEVIIVDDGSTDKTAEIVKNYQQAKEFPSYPVTQLPSCPISQLANSEQKSKQTNRQTGKLANWQTGEHVTLIYIYQENGGPSMARNTGIKRASGKYITFLDADDLWPEDKLQKQVDLMEIHREVMLLFGDVQRFSENNGIVASMFIRRGITEEFFGDSFYVEDAYKKLLTRNYIPTSAVIIRREYFQYRDLLDENFRCMEDWDLWLRIAMNGTIAYSTDVWELKRDHKDNVSSNIEAMLLAMIEVLKKHEKNFQPYLRKCNINLNNNLRDSYLTLGIYYLEQWQTLKARKAFLKSLHNGIRIKPVLFWLSTFFNYHKAKSHL